MTTDNAGTITDSVPLSAVAPTFEPSDKNEVGAHFIYAINSFTGEFGQSWRVTYGKTAKGGPSGVYLMGGDNAVRADQFAAINRALEEVAYDADGNMHRRVVGPVVLEQKMGNNKRPIWNITDAQ